MAPPQKLTIVTPFVNLLQICLSIGTKRRVEEHFVKCISTLVDAWQSSTAVTANLFSAIYCTFGKNAIDDVENDDNNAGASVDVDVDGDDDGDVLHLASTTL